MHADSDTSAELEPQDELDVNPLTHVIAPIAAVFVTMIVRSAVNKGYRKTTGKDAPDARDPRVGMVRAIAWTALIATTAAVAEVVVYRAVNRLGTKPHQG
jgi:hypothetical protein